MMRLVIDRFEGAYAVCEDENKNMVAVLKTKLPEDAKEGSVLKTAGESIIVDQAETNYIKKRIKEKMDAMWDE